MAVRLLDYAFKRDLGKVKRCINSGIDLLLDVTEGMILLVFTVTPQKSKSKTIE